MDAFQMLWEAKKYGARAALYGRKINNAEHQLTFVQYLRRLADDQIQPADAVRAYHADLERLGIQPARALDADLELTPTAYGYADGTQSSSSHTSSSAANSVSSTDPDFSSMTPAEKARWNLERWRRILD